MALLGLVTILLLTGLFVSGCGGGAPTSQPADVVVETPLAETPTAEAAATEAPTIEAPTVEAPAATEFVSETGTITEESGTAATGEMVVIENVSFVSNPTLASSWSGHLVEDNSDINVPPDLSIGPPRVVITATTGLTRDDGSSIEPYLFVYKVADLAATPEQDRVDGLATLLAANEPLSTTHMLPYLPLVNAAQVVHGAEERLNFANGQGIRYLAGFGQDPSPFLGRSFVYTFQGLTSDGQYYMALTWPLSTELFPAELPADFDAGAYFAAIDQYLADTRATLSGAAPTAFTPDLTALDALVQSIEIK